MDFLKFSVKFGTLVARTSSLILSLMKHGLLYNTIGSFPSLAIWEEHKLEQARIKSWLTSLEHFQWESFKSVPNKELQLQHPLSN